MDLIEIFVNVDKGTKLYSPLFKEPLTFLHINYTNNLPIRCMTKEGLVIGFSREGYHTNIPSSLACVLFPTPEMTWDNIIYIKEGDLLLCTNEIGVTQYFIAKKTGFYTINNTIPCYCGIRNNGTIYSPNEYYICAKGTANDLKEFKKILTKYNYCLEGYSINEKEPKKFDFDSFTEFDKVLVRDSDIQFWRGDFFQYKKEDVFICTGSRLHFCIPYNDDTKHLVGTSMPAPEYYRE